MLATLADPRLTGMTAVQLERLAAALAPVQAARAQQRYSQQRAGRARRATGNVRARPLFDDAARLLLTLLYQRQVCSMNVLADLLEVTATCIGDLVKETRGILEDHGHGPGAAPIRFSTADALLAFADSDLRPARATIIERLSHPALTGLTQHELHDLTTRLAARATIIERLTYQRRGGPRQSGARGGVFHQKISNSERILLALLYHRRLCTLDVLADALGDVSRSAIGNVIRETLPLLQQEDRIPGLRQLDTAQPPISSQPEHQATRRHVDSLRLHRARNVLAKVPAAMQAEVKDAFWALFDTENLKTKPGPGSSSSSITGSPRWLPGTARPTRRR